MPPYAVGEDPRGLFGGPVRLAPLAANQAALDSLSPYFRTTRVDSRMPPTTKLAATFETHLDLAGFLAGCALLGLDEPATKAAVYRDAARSPRAAARWNAFFAKLAAGPVPAPLPAPFKPPSTFQVMARGFGTGLRRGGAVLGEGLHRFSNLARGAAYAGGGGAGALVTGIPRLGAEAGHQMGLVGRPALEALRAANNTYAEGAGAGLMDLVTPFTAKGESQVDALNAGYRARLEAMPEGETVLGLSGRGAANVNRVADGAARYTATAAVPLGGPYAAAGKGGRTFLQGAARGLSGAAPQAVAQLGRLRGVAQFAARPAGKSLLQAGGILGSQAAMTGAAEEVPKFLWPESLPLEPPGGSAAPSGGEGNAGTAPEGTTAPAPAATAPEPSPASTASPVASSAAPVPATATAAATPSAPAPPPLLQRPPELPTPKPLPALSADVIGRMAPEEAQARGAWADEQMADLGTDQFRALPKEQQAATIESVFKNKLAAQAKQTGSDPAKLLAKAEQGGWDRSDLDLLASTPAGTDLAEATGTDPLSAVVRFFTDPERPAWQKALVGGGIPLAVLGLAHSLFGDGGMQGLLMGILGLGAAAGGLGAFGGSGPLSGSFLDLGSLFGGGGGEATAPPAAGAGVPPMLRPPVAGPAPAPAPAPAGGVPPMLRPPVVPEPGAPPPTLAGIMAGGIDPGEVEQLRTTPALRQELLHAAPAVQDQAVQQLVAGQPDVAGKLDWALGLSNAAPRWARGVAMTPVYNATRQQFGLSPQETDALLQAWQRVRGAH